MSTPAVPACGPQPLPRWVVWSLLLILLFALGTDLIFFTGFYASDDLQYIRGAQQLAESGRLSYLTLGTIRLGLVVPLAFVAKVTDNNLFLMAASFVFYHLLGVVGTYWLGSLVHGRHTGVLAAGFMAICPAGVLFATMILPDHPATALAVLSAGCLLAGRARLSATPSQARSTWALFGLSGVLFALALTTKEVTIVLLPVFLLVIASRFRHAPARAVLRAGLLFALGTGIAALALWALFYTVTGLRSPLQDARLVSVLSSMPERTEAEISRSPADRLRRLVGLATDKRDLALFTWAPLLALVGYPLLRGRSWGLYAALIWVCAYMTWGSFSLARYMPPPMLLRYFILAFPAMMVMSAFVIVTVLRPVWSRFGGRAVARSALIGLAAILCGIVVVDSYGTLNRGAGKAYWAGYVYATRQALDYIGQSDERPVVLSYWLSVRLSPMLKVPEMARVMGTRPSTAVGDLTAHLDGGSFYYIDCDVERRSGRYWREPSPLDAEVRAALAGQESSLRVRTLASFGQFKTRLAALHYIYGGSADCMDLRERGRLIFVREVALPPRTSPG